jgi:hypothetical protein
LRVALLLAVAACATSSLAHAQLSPGFALSWNNCIGLPGAAQNLDYACDGSRDGNPFRLVVTFTPPSDLGQFVAIYVYLGVRTTVPTLPDWWRFGAGECRYGLMAFPGSRAGIGTGAAGACIDPWAGANTGGGFQWTSDEGMFCSRFGCSPAPAPGSGALLLAFARDTSVPLQAGQRYLIAPILLDPVDPNSYADPLCAGCAAPACLFVRAMELYQIAGQVPPQQDVYYMRETSERPFVTWQGGGVSGNECPLEVPVRRATWGAIKAIYR